MPTGNPGLNPRLVSEAAALIADNVVNAMTTSRLNPNLAVLTRVGRKM